MTNEKKTLTLNELEFDQEHGIIMQFNDHEFPKNIVIPKQLNGVPVRAISGVFEGAFEGAGLTHVDLPDSIVFIDKNVFSDNQLTNLIIPHSVKAIEEHAFQGNELKRVVIPKSVVSLHKNAFDHDVEIIRTGTVSRVLSKLSSLIKRTNTDN